MREIGDPTKIVWHVGPVPKTLPAVPICRAKPNVQLRYTLLSGTWVAIEVHSIDRRDTPCLGENCPHYWRGFHRTVLLKWYTDGYSHLSNRCCLVEVTAGAMQPFLDAAGQVIPFRRGQQIEISRAGPKPHSPGVLTVLPAETTGDQLPPSFCVRSALLRNWMGDTHIRGG